MRFSPRLPNDTATLTLAASFLIVVLMASVNFSHDPAAHHTRTISIVGAIVLLAVYATWLPRYLREGAGAEATDRGAATSRPQDRRCAAGCGWDRLGVRVGLVRARA